MDRKNAVQTVENALARYRVAKSDKEKTTALEDMKEVYNMCAPFGISGISELGKAISECSLYLIDKLYDHFEVYSCPEKPTEEGTYIGKTPMYEQAVNACKNAEAVGKSYFIKAVDRSGKKFFIL